MSSSIPVVLHGAAGRMGQAILRVLDERADLTPVAALVRADSARVGQPVYPFSERTLRYAGTLAPDLAASVLIDFSVADAFDHGLALALERKLPFVSGTTGLDARQRAALERAAASIPTLWAANFSLGVAVLAKLVAAAARAVPEWDCEIAEAHHAGKHDAPSGTGLMLGREVAAARGQDFDAVARYSHAGNARARGTIGFASTRAADIVGEHTVMFATAGERIELVHRATDRMIFARGAVAAARWIAGRPAGRYSLEDVIFS
ncbi:4-hydroxy-tetrahydrodipicolinate reductase [Dokdonella sp.]|uniref:4-hydroxy-tetrahydrodipicolinate reductase n=1 Tax=Dokdonella sp. TaxID=2291710 RepID=UPI001B16036E|nr:4-hydroxy-tetrahydrodipicolinate reductase [Dokdonella sp.]MBO9662614.1 4-hydroxy-tetrahydrodipicolinate reductase [Dokdonella sp.]